MSGRRSRRVGRRLNASKPRSPRSAISSHRLLAPTQGTKRRSLPFDSNGWSPATRRLRPRPMCWQKERADALELAQKAREGEAQAVALRDEAASLQAPDEAELGRLRAAEEEARFTAAKLAVGLTAELTLEVGHRDDRGRGRECVEADSRARQAHRVRGPTGTCHRAARRGDAPRAWGRPGSQGGGGSRRGPLAGCFGPRVRPHRLLQPRRTRCPAPARRGPAVAGRRTVPRSGSGRGPRRGTERHRAAAGHRAGGARPARRRPRGASRGATDSGRSGRDLRRAVR